MPAHKQKVLIIHQQWILKLILIIDLALDLNFTFKILEHKTECDTNEEASQHFNLIYGYPG